MDCGVSAFLTQPVLSERAALNLEQARRTLGGAKLIGGLFPVGAARKTPVFYKAKCMASRWRTTSLCALDAGLDREQGEALAVRLCEAAAKRIAPFNGRLLHHDPVPARGACVPRDACDPEFGRIRA